MEEAISALRKHWQEERKRIGDEEKALINAMTPGNPDKAARMAKLATEGVLIEKFLAELDFILSP